VIVIKQSLQPAIRSGPRPAPGGTDKSAVFVVDEARSPVVAALDDMYGIVGEHACGRSWHVRSTRERPRVDETWSVPI